MPLSPLSTYRCFPLTQVYYFTKHLSAIISSPQTIKNYYICIRNNSRSVSYTTIRPINQISNQSVLSSYKTIFPISSSKPIYRKQSRNMSSFAGDSSSADTAPSNIIDGNAIAAQIRIELKQTVAEMKESLGVVPGLAVILVGDRKDSATYVRMKKRACAEVGVESFGFDYPSEVTQEELLAKIDELNADPSVHGILVQLPLPPHINEAAVVQKVSVSKDVDGLHPLNIAELTNTKSNSPLHVSCTPQGCIELLLRSGVKIEGKEAVILGRSNIVGMPVALLLMQRNATVTIAHSKTKDLPDVLKRADIVVAAIGRASMVQGEWLKPGCVVLDVGINSVEDSTDKRGYRLVGDCHFESCSKVASLITPVPGGVGPMTIAMLLKNTINGARRSALESKASKESSL